MEKETECPCLGVEGCQCGSDCQFLGECVSCVEKHAAIATPPRCFQQEAKSPEELMERVAARLRAADIAVRAWY